MTDGAPATEAYVAVSELFGALSSPVRAAIVHRLTDHEYAVHELVDELGVSQPLVSQHLRVLRAARLVKSVRVGRTLSYQLNDQHVAHVFLDALHHIREETHDDH